MKTTVDKISSCDTLALFVSRPPAGCRSASDRLPWSPVKEFAPFFPLRNAHLMTIAGGFWPRRFPRLGLGVPRLFEVEPDTQIRGDCHWQSNPREHSTLVLVHGLEGSSDSNYILGAAEKAWLAGFNVVRLNQRTCGGTDHLTHTLYHAGRSGDIRAVLLELIERDRLPEIFVAGFSMGGNIVLKMAGEFGDAAPRALRAILAIAPSIHMVACADSLEEPRNVLYRRHFVRSLKIHMRYKAGLFPQIYPPAQVAELLDGRSGRGVRTVREFDDAITARFCGFRDAADYYAQSSARRVVTAIRRTTWILSAEDDPIVPITIFDDRAVRENLHIAFVSTRHGGHCAFISQEGGAERFWAEARLVEYCLEKSELAARLQATGCSSET
jgi:uncharacterized protein